MRYLSLALAATATLASCAAPEYESRDYVKIGTQAEFVSLFVDHSLKSAAGNDRYVLHRDGSLSGVFKGSKVSGTWEWKDGQYCREVRLPTSSLPYECTPVWISKSMVRLNQRGGHGGYTYYLIEG